MIGHALSGLAAYTYWEVWVAGLFFLVPFLGGIALFADHEDGKGVLDVARGPDTPSRLMTFARLALATAGTIVYVTTVLPIVLGGSDDAMWNSVSALSGQDASFLMKLFVVSFLIGVAVNFIPLIGMIPGIRTFATASYVMAVWFVTETAAIVPPIEVKLWPGVVTFLFFAIATVAFGLVVSIVANKCVELLGGGTPEESVFTAYVVFAMPNFLSHAGAFMYASWLRGQLTG